MPIANVRHYECDYNCTDDDCPYIHAPTPTRALIGQMPNPDAIALKLSPQQARIMRKIGAGATDWFSASDFGDERPSLTGSLLQTLVKLGLFERRADPKIWGRNQYRVLGLGEQVSHILHQTPAPAAH